jgi:hypothetical protein
MKARTFVLLTAFVSSIALLPLVASSRATSSRPSAVKLRFAPEEGSSVTKSFESKTTLTLDELEVSGAGGQAPDIEMSMALSQKIVVTDQYVKNRANAPQKLVRSFDELGGEQSASMKMEIMGERQTKDHTMRAKSALEGKKVAFEWDAEESAYKKTFDPAEEEMEVLETVEEDMDMRNVLPGDAVEEGAEWDVPMRGLRTLFAPGGNLALVPENTEEDAMKMGLDSSSLSEMIGEKLEGTAKAKLVKIEELDGVQCARIHISLDVKSSADMTEVARKKLEGSDLPPGFELDHLDVSFAFAGEGDLLWNIAGGHFHNLDMSGQMTIKNEQGVRLEVGGRKMSVDQTMTLSGSSTYTAKAR